MALEMFVAFNSSRIIGGNDDSPADISSSDHLDHDSTISIQHYIPVQYFLGTCYAMIILLSLLGNLAVILAVLIFHQLKSLNNYLLMSLAAADLTVTILVMPFALIQDISGEWGQSRTFCLFWMSWDVMCCTASLQHLCAVAWDRYVFITDPYNYTKRMTMTKVTFIILSIWIVSALISFLPIFMGWFTKAGIVSSRKQCVLETNRYYAVASALISFYLPFLGMTYCYYKIFGIVRQKILMNQCQQKSLLYSSVRAALLQVDNQNPSSREANGRVSTSGMRDFKATKTLGIVFGMFFFCWWPFFIQYWLDAFMSPSHIPQPVHSIITWLGYLNSALNPIIYSWNPIFRAAYKQLFCYVIAPCSPEIYGRISGLLTPSPSEFAVKLATRNHSTGSVGITDDEVRELELIFWPPQRPLFRNSCEGPEELTVMPTLHHHHHHHLTVNDGQPIRRRSYVMPGSSRPKLGRLKSHEFEDGMEALLGRSTTIRHNLDLCK